MEKWIALVAGLILLSATTLAQSETANNDAGAHETFSYNITATGTAPGYEYNSWSKNFYVSCSASGGDDCSKTSTVKVCVDSGSGYAWKRCHHGVSHSGDGNGGIASVSHDNSCCSFTGYAECSSGYLNECGSVVSGRVYVEGQKPVNVSWSGNETGFSSVTLADRKKSVVSSSLFSPNMDTQWSAIDDNGKAKAWMEGGDLYACLDSDSDYTCDYTTVPGHLEIMKSLPVQRLEIPKSGEFSVMGGVSCVGGSCGSVTVYARHNKTDALPDALMVKDDGALFIKNTGPDAYPKECGEMPIDSECAFSWLVVGRDAGEYLLDAAAYSTKDGVPPVYSGESVVSVSPGVIRVEVSQPPQICVETETTIKASAFCDVQPCGTMMAYLTINGRLVKYGDITTNDGNPQSCEPAAGTPCNFTWTVKPFVPGDYMMKVLVQSSLHDVADAWASINLTALQRPVGGLYFSPYAPVMIAPSTTGVSRQVNVSATALCSTGYCGGVNATLMVNGGDPAGSNVTLAGRSTKPCASMPCSISWILLPRTTGIYRISVLFASNESVSPINDTKSLYVADSLDTATRTVVSMATPGYYEAGGTFKVKSVVTCHGECGRVSVRLLCDGTEISPGTPIQAMGNSSRLMELSNGESGELEWLVKAGNAGEYLMRVSAEPEWANVTGGLDEKVFSITRGITASILSPSGGNFTRGGAVPLRMELLTQGAPMKGAPVVVTTFPALFSATLYDDGMHGDGAADDGVYGETAFVPRLAKEGGYDVLFNAEGVEEITRISVSPRLSISFTPANGAVSAGGKIRITGNVTKNGAPAGANVTVSFSYQNWRVSEVVSAGNGSFLYERQVSFGDPPGMWQAEVSAVDMWDNRGSASSSLLVTGRKGTICDFRINSPMDTRQGVIYNAGNRMELAVETPCKPVKVSCVLPWGQEELKWQAGNTYRGSHDIPVTAKGGIYSISCQATGGGYVGGQYVNVEIRPAGIIMELLYPQAAGRTVRLESGRAVKFVVRASYPEGGIAANASIKANAGGKNVTFAMKGSTYEGEFTPGAEGYYALSLVGTDAAGNMGWRTFDMAVESGPGAWLLPLALVLAAAVAAGLFVIRKNLIAETKKRTFVVVKEVPVFKPGPDKATLLKNELEKLEREEKSLANAKDVVEMKYYKRELDEKEFMGMMEGYEQKLIMVRMKINEVNKVLKSTPPGKT